MKRRLLADEGKRAIAAFRPVSILAMGILLAGMGSTARAVPIADGRVTAGEYAYSRLEYFADQKDSKKVAPDPGTLYWDFDAAGNVYAAFVMPLSLNDNTYGTTSIGWGSQAPNGKDHKFSNLTGSDKGTFVFRDATGKIVLELNLDYLTYDKKTKSYRSLGVSGGDGKMVTGSAASVLGYGTSLDYNFNALGYNTYTTNSPAAHPTAGYNPNGSVNYSMGYTSDDPNAPDWVYNLIYEVKISASVFAASGFGSVDFPFAHNSPNKIGDNVFFELPPSPPVIPVVPEPGTAMGGLVGLALLTLSRSGLPGLARRWRQAGKA